MIVAPNVAVSMNLQCHITTAMTVIKLSAQYDRDRDRDCDRDRERGILEKMMSSLSKSKGDDQ
jgi:hypothetical protein